MYTAKFIRTQFCCREFTVVDLVMAMMMIIIIIII